MFRSEDLLGITLERGFQSHEPVAVRHFSHRITSVEGFRQAVDLLLPADTARERHLLADALFGLGTALFRSERTKSAKPVLEAALGAFPRDSRGGQARLFLGEMGASAVFPAEDSYWEGVCALMRKVQDWKRKNGDRLSPKG